MDEPTPHVALLVDGHNLLYASYFGMPDRIRAPDGRPVHGTYGFLASLLAMLRRFTPSAVVVCFDPEAQTDRHAMYAGYKANRAAVDPERNPFSQLGDIRRGLDRLGIPWIEEGGVEADDMIASIATAVAGRFRVVVSSMDQDMLQLVAENVHVYARGRGREREYDVAAVVTRYGVTPDQFVDYRALVGDASDNIPGVPGIGPKTARLLLSGFGSIEGLYAAVDALPLRVARGLEDNRESLKMSRALLRVRRDVPVDPGLVQTWQGRDAPQARWSARDLMSALGLWR